MALGKDPVSYLSVCSHPGVAAQAAGVSPAWAVRRGGCLFRCLHSLTSDQRNPFKLPCLSAIRASFFPVFSQVLE